MFAPFAHGGTHARVECFDRCPESYDFKRLRRNDVLRKCEYEETSPAVTSSLTLTDKESPEDLLHKLELIEVDMAAKEQELLKQ